MCKNHLCVIRELRVLYTSSHIAYCSLYGCIDSLLHFMPWINLNKEGQ